MDKLKASRLTKLSRVKNNVKDNRFGFYEMWEKHHYNLLKGKDNPLLTKSYIYPKLVG
tara:strand:- start:1074 stop:1247 length:174 start_codon:yes stop_codon:yes gene_type:complete